MKRTMNLALLLCLALPLAGCPAATAPTPPTAPGYQNIDDQKLGRALAAVNGFRKSEEGNYNCDTAALAADTCLTSAQKTVEKPYLNDFINAVNLANTAYTAYHAGTQTLAQAQVAEKSAETSQASLATAKGVK